MNFTNSSSEILVTDTIQSEQLVYPSNLVMTNSIILISLAAIVLVLLLISVIACLEEESLGGSFQRRNRRSGNANPNAYNDDEGYVVYHGDLNNNNVVEV